MITLTARIDLISGTTPINGITCNVSGNNISADFKDMWGRKSKATTPFVVGSSKLGNGETYSEKVDYFIGTIKSDNNGYFAQPYIIEIKSLNAKSLTIAFDNQNNRHPNTIDINGTTYTDDDAIFTVNDISPEGQEEFVTITINNWNTPNYPVVITGIYVDVQINLDKRNLISLNRNIACRADDNLPSYGIKSNTGHIAFKDLDGEIRDYAEHMLLASDLKVNIFVNNTLTKNAEQVAEFETQYWDYDNDNRTVSVSLKDNLEEWQDISVNGFDYDPRNPYKVLANGNMADLYKWLWNKTPKKYQMLAFGDLDETTRNILTSTIIKYPLLKSGTLWSQWHKLCEVCGLYIYKNNKGNTVCIHTLGS